MRRKLTRLPCDFSSPFIVVSNYYHFMLLDYQEQVVSGPMKPLVEVWTDPISKADGESKKRLEEKVSGVVPSPSLSSPPAWSEEELVA